MPRFAIVARLTVARDALSDFHQFEHRAAAVMRAHGGRIEQTVVLDADAAAPTLVEVHIVTFPDAAAWASYRDDPALRRLQGLRERAVVATEIEEGVEGPDYDG
jgi:hypothetical protein